MKREGYKMDNQFDWKVKKMELEEKKDEGVKDSNLNLTNNPNPNVTSQQNDSKLTPTKGVAGPKK